MREAIKSSHRALGATVGAVWCNVHSLLQNPTPYHGVISPSPLAPRNTAEPKKTQCFCIGASLLTSTWLGLSWAPFCLPQAPRSSAGPRKTRCFCISTEVPMQKRRVFSGSAEARGAGGRQKRAQRAPDHVDVSTETPFQKHRVLRDRRKRAAPVGRGISLRGRG